MERALMWLLTRSGPLRDVDWLRRHRLAVLLVLTVLAWLPILGLAWLVLRIS